MNETGIERLLIVILLSACWVFVFIGIQGQEDDEDPTIVDMIAFCYSNIITVVVTLYILYKIITE